jgi:hypothetical protein
VPCAAPVRGKTDLKLPWVDAVNNDPCGKGIVATVNGVDKTAEALCFPHWVAKNGYAEVKGAITFGA